MNNPNALQVQDNAVSVHTTPMGLTEVKAQIKLLQEIMRGVMEEGPDKHYGTVPGCGKRKVLFKAGAEKLCLTFRLSPKYEIESQDLGGGHRNFYVKCFLYSITTGAFIGEGVGSCSTMEGKYRFRKAEQVCPVCGVAAIRKGSQQYGGGWYCDKNKDGCGAKFKEDDPDMDNLDMGRVEHDNPPDYWNTCLKMGKKRAYVDATISATGASDIFTQDLEDDDIPPGEGAAGKKQNAGQGNKGGELQDKETLLRADIVDWCLEMAGGDKKSKEAKAILEEATAFTGRDGKEVPGVKDPSKLTGQRLTIAHAKIHEKHDKWSATNKQAGPDSTNAPEEPDEDAQVPKLPF